MSREFQNHHEVILLRRCIDALEPSFFLEALEEELVEHVPLELELLVEEVGGGGDDAEEEEGLAGGEKDGTGLTGEEDAFEGVETGGAVPGEFETVGTLVSLEPEYALVLGTVSSLFWLISAPWGEFKKMSFCAPSAKPHLLLYAGLFGIPERSFPDV